MYARTASGLTGRCGSTEPGIAATASSSSRMSAIRMLVSDRQKFRTVLMRPPLGRARRPGSYLHPARAGGGPQPDGERVPRPGGQRQPDQDQQRPAEPGDPDAVTPHRPEHADQLAEAQPERQE